MVRIRRGCKRDDGSNCNGYQFISHLNAPFVLLALLLTEALVCGLDKHIRCPWAGLAAVSVVPALRRFGRFHLFERQAIIDTILNAVPDDREHVSIKCNVREVADTSMTRNDHRASLTFEIQQARLEYQVQAIDDPLKTAALFQVNDRPAGC